MRPAAGGLRADIADLRAVYVMNDVRNNFTAGEPGGSATCLNEAHQRFGNAIHARVKHHPDSGRPSLFVNPGDCLPTTSTT